MSRSRQYHTNFSAGVISPQAEARIDSNAYNAGLSIGKNILIQTTGAMTRRPGSIFIRDYGNVEYVRIFPFIFNTEQKFVIVMYLEATETKIDIYQDNVLVFPDLMTPYTTKEEVMQLDFAQSADSMIITQALHIPQQLRRRGANDDWDIIPVPLINAPCDSMVCVSDLDPDDTAPPTCGDGSIPYCGTGKCLDDTEPTCEVDFTLTTLDTWSDENGYPKYCTFHQGRLWFAGSTNFPQSVWGSKAQDFFNFDVGIGDPADSIHETLDTDFINPITSIYSAGKLQVFTSGAEFVNGAQVITPTTSSWAKQTTYGSSDRVQPISVDGSTLFLDNTERIVRAFTYSDDLKGYDSPSISAESEHLIKGPINMGTMRGDIQESSNFIYIVNGDGTMAVLNYSKAYGMNAWTEWQTQGRYQQIMDLDRDLYILVKRYVDTGSGLEFHWMLERLSKKSLTDSSSVVESLTDTTLTGVGKDNDNFFGVYYPSTDDTGKVVIVQNGIVMYQSDYLEADPLKSIRTLEDILFSAGNVFDVDESVRELYFAKEAGYRWYMHTLTSLQLINNAQNYIDGLTHLVNQSAVAVLDGAVFSDLTVTAGEPLETVEISYPDGADWIHDKTADAETYLRKTSLDGTTVTWEGWYQGTYYPLLQETEWGLLIAGAPGEGGSEYLQIGTQVTEDTQVSPVLLTASATLTAGTEIPANTVLTIQGVAGGGGGGGGGAGGRDNDGPDGQGGRGGQGGGHFDLTTTLTLAQAYPLTVGVGGGQASAGGNTTGFGLTASGGAGGANGCSSCCGHQDCNCHRGIAGTASVLSPGAIAPPCTAGASHTGASGYNGLLGAGGSGGSGGTGGDFYGDSGGESSNGGSGGTGRISIAWEGGVFGVDEYRTRKMALVSVVVTDGMVFFPDYPFVVGEAGLLFTVQAVTLPINVSAGGGSLVNEPKRIVAVTAKYYETRGVELNGFSIPERQFGSAVFDNPSPLRTGIDKIRFLGYTRDTRLYISQDGPMPMTLLSLDIDVNY